MLATTEELTSVHEVKELELSEKQFLSLGESQGRVNLWEGSIRSGKTFVSFLRFCGFIATYQGPGSFVMIGKSRDTLWRNVFEPLERDPAMAFLQPFVQYRQGSPTATIFGIGVSVMGANDAKAESSIRGVTVAGAYGDEITTWSVDFFKQLLGRMSPKGAQFFGTTNPDNPQHWLKTDYLDKLDTLPNWRHWHFTLDDNTTLDPDYIESIKREYTGLWFQRFILGLWVSAEGAIFPEWDVKRHVIPWQSMPRISRVLSLGIDFGITNATVAIMIGITDETDGQGRPRPRLVAMDEWAYDSKITKQRLAPSDLAKRIQRWLIDVEHAPYDLDVWPEIVSLDPSAAPLAEELVKLGINPTGADNTVTAGISDISNLLHTGRLIVTDRCPTLIKEIPGYVWDEKATKKGQDAPVKENDHATDGLRYAIRSTHAWWSTIMRNAYALAA